MKGSRDVWMISEVSFVPISSLLGFSDREHYFLSHQMRVQASYVSQGLDRKWLIVA